MEFDTVIRGGTLITPSGPILADLGIAGERIAAIAPRLDGVQVIDATRMLVLPGAIDPHVMPIDRGHEADGDVIDGPQSIIYKQAENRLHIQKALMALTMTPRA